MPLLFLSKDIVLQGPSIKTAIHIFLNAYCEVHTIETREPHMRLFFQCILVLFVKLESEYNNLFKLRLQKKEKREQKEEEQNNPTDEKKSEPDTKSTFHTVLDSCVLALETLSKICMEDAASLVVSSSNSTLSSSSSLHTVTPQSASVQAQGAVVDIQLIRKMFCLFVIMNLLSDINPAKYLFQNYNRDKLKDSTYQINTLSPLGKGEDEKYIFYFIFISLLKCINL
jgi:hypothetical protein